MNAIEISALHKRYRPTTTWADIVRGRFRRDEVTALCGVDMTVTPGELVGIAGPNGAGKSTLLRAVAGLLLPTEGTVSVFGAPSTDSSVSYRRTVGYALSSERSHFWRLSGHENLRFFAALHGHVGAERDERIHWALETVDLQADAERPVREYSTGMRQRLSLARALLGSPRVLLLDEPTRGLDPSAARRLQTLVKTELVERQGVTVLYATHKVDEMSGLCPRLVLLSKGAIVGDGTFTSLKRTFDEVFP